MKSRILVLVSALILVGCAGGGGPVSAASSGPSPTNGDSGGGGGGPAAGPSPSAPATNTGDTNCVDSTGDALSLRAEREQVCALVNVERAKVGVRAVVLEAKRSAVSQSYADEMTARNFFSHTSPDGDGPAERLAAGGVTWTTWGENIALNSSGGPAAVMTQWMNSPGHRANILNAAFGRLGVGHDGANWVQDFTN